VGPPGLASIFSPPRQEGNIALRLAFVIRLGNDTRPADGEFEGWVQEVDTCCEERFRSTEELLNFLGERFDLLMVSGGKGRPSDSGPAPIKKNSRKRRGLP
jgi:hypothetical protein